jgi:hypothetical protein
MRPGPGLPISPRTALNSSSPPKHGSWLDLVEGFFSKPARSLLRHIRVVCKQELKHQLMQAMDYFNHPPVARTWSYLLENAA